MQTDCGTHVKLDLSCSKQRRWKKTNCYGANIPGALAL